MNEWETKSPSYLFTLPHFCCCLPALCYAKWLPLQKGHLCYCCHLSAQWKGKACGNNNLAVVEILLTLLLLWKAESNIKVHHKGLVAQTSPQQPYYDSSTYYGNKDTDVSHISEVTGEGRENKEGRRGMFLVLPLQEVQGEEGQEGKLKGHSGWGVQAF